MTTAERTKLEEKVSELKNKLTNVKGTPCEVYSRVVGYLRPVQCWNNGKKIEFAMRKTMKIDNCCHCD